MNSNTLRERSQAEHWQDKSKVTARAQPSLERGIYSASVQELSAARSFPRVVRVRELKRNEFCAPLTATRQAGFTLIVPIDFLKRPANYSYLSPIPKTSVKVRADEFAHIAAGAGFLQSHEGILFSWPAGRRRRPGRTAECNSAIQQIENLRYAKYIHTRCIPPALVIR